MILIIYDTLTGNTEAMAHCIATAVKDAGHDAVLKKVEAAQWQDLIDADAILIGSPTHFGMMSSKMKQFIDRSNDIWGKLDKKIGAAFTSSGGISGGNETTLLSLIQAMLIHGMIVVSPPGRYGLVAIEKPHEKTRDSCQKLAKRIIELVDAC
jgi:NAD(P)H dehydrogenase (quinone)